MTQLQRVSVEGFKAIDSLEFEPGAINVVTGRNNSGKTSLLEAIDLGVQPENIDGFGGNLDTIINNRHDESRIAVDTCEKTNELLLTLPGKQQATEWILETTRSVLYENWELIAIDDANRNEVIETIDAELPSLFTGHIEEDLINMAIEETISVKISGVNYPYVYFGDALDSIIMDIYTTIRRSVLEDSGEKESEFFGLIPGVRADNQTSFLSESPPNISNSRFIDFVQLSKSLDLESDEDDPVKIDDIGDFLREKEIVEDLKTFDLDYLIFEDDGEKYSVPFDHMGEGFKTFVGILWHLFDVEGSADVVLLEEPNTHMHPGYVRQLTYFLIDLAREEDIQLFITTHNNDFLNDFFTENLKAKERDFLEEEFRLVQMQDGTADVMTYEEAEKQLKDLHLDLRGI